MRFFKQQSHWWIKFRVPPLKKPPLRAFLSPYMKDSASQIFDVHVGFAPNVWLAPLG
jgi:hypothetical protein